MVYSKKMVKKTAFFGFLLIVAAGALFAQTLTIRVENTEPDKGYLMVGVFDSKNKFPDNYFQGQRMKATDRTMVVVFDKLPRGTYAVSAYQDANENEQLDKNFLGIPKERYGFSNNSDRPVYEKCLFDFTNDMTIAIKLSK